MSYIRRERDWADRARAEGRILDDARLLPVLPASFGNGHGPRNGNGHGAGTVHGHDH
jgi:hypothetical protein